MSDSDVAGAAVQTPWGHAAELRERRLHPSSGTPRSEVIQNQRERLFAAIFAVVADKGYEASTVANVVELSGVSRSAFYEHFANKAECLAAAAAELIEPTVTRLRAIDGEEAVLEHFFELLDRQPAAAWVWFVELPAAGGVGEAVVERGMAELTALLTELVEDGGGTGPDSELSPMVVAGLHKLIQARLCRGEQGGLKGIAPDLWRWVSSISASPIPLAPRRGRAEVGAHFQGYTPAERITRAVASVVSERGYLGMSTDDIAAQASISLSTFYAHFADKRDAVLAALEMSGAQVMALAGPAARRAGDWQHGVRALYEAICAYLAAEPNLARLATIGVYGAGQRALRRRDRVIDSLSAMLAPAYEENPASPSISAEAGAATAFAVIAMQVRESGPENLTTVVPLATYLTLVGFIGPEHAAAVATS